MKLNKNTRGVFIISVTPFTDAGAIDFASSDRLVDFYLESGVYGITLLGMMGEAPKLDPADSVAFMGHVLARVDGRVPVVVGVSNPGLDNLAELARRAGDGGAAGLLVAPLAGLNTEEKILRYFDQVCAAVGPDLPVVYQDYPQATGCHISVPAFNRLIDAQEQVVMLKHEDCPGLGKITQVRQSAEAEGRERISILVGNGGLYLPQELARGADGAMTGFAFPEMLVGVCQRFAAGDPNGAEDLFDAYLPLVRHEQQPGFGLALRKEALRRRGVIASARTRAPGPSLTADDHAELSGLMARLERRLNEMNG